MLDTPHSILRSARSFLAGTALSRVSGLLRDIVMAIYFGSSPAVAAFMVSYRLTNLFRRLLGEGNLQAGFVPHFVELKEQGAIFYRDVAFSMAAILCLVLILLEGVLWLSLSLAPADWIEIIELSMWMAPGLFFISLYGLNAALLQCRKKYFLPAVAPIAFNLVWIAAVLYFPDVRFLSMAITAACAGQWLMTVPEGARLLSFKEWLKPKLFSPGFKVFLRPLMLGIVGVSAVQLNSALDTIFARFADLQGPAFLWYAIRIQQLPLALFGLALSGALLPSLSRTEDPSVRKQLLHSALKQSSLLMLICTFAIFALGSVGVNLLYGHGDFSPASVQETRRCLWGYGVGLIPSVFTLLLAARYYAEKNYRTPTLASLAAVGANIALNALFVFVFHWGAVSIAIATSLSSLLNMALLARGAFTLELARFFAQTALASAIPAALVLGVEQMALEPLPRLFAAQLLQFGILSTIYLGTLAILIRGFGLQKRWS